MYVIHLAKELFKFSCSHFTILSPDQAERLHGHNYQVRAFTVNEIDPKLGFAFDFNAVKPAIRNFCDALDERILIPTRSPYLQVKNSAEQIEIVFGRKHYAFPSEDCLCVPLTNITTEELARYTCEKLVAEFADLPYWKSLQVHIEETRGQSVSYIHKR